MQHVGVKVKKGTVLPTGIIPVIQNLGITMEVRGRLDRFSQEEKKKPPLLTK